MNKIGEDKIGEIHEIIKKALRCFIKNDRYLLENKLNERTQTHKLAEYLQDFLLEWNVDCEYNRNLNKPSELNFDEIVNGVKNIVLESDYKEISNLKRELTDINDKKIADENGKSSFLLFTNSKKKKYIKRVFPDIIAHLRGTTQNKIVIEVKKTSNKDKKARYFDLIKLGLFTKKDGEYNYDIGYFIDLPNKIPENFKIEIRKCNENIGISYHSVYVVKIT